MKTLKICMLLAVLTVVFSCSKEEGSAVQNQEENLQLTKSKGGTETFKKDIEIEWGAKTTEARKAGVRQLYINIGVLAEYTPCPQNTKVEKWVINCETGHCSRESDTPVNTDDDVKRVSFIIHCEN